MKFVNTIRTKQKTTRKRKQQIFCLKNKTTNIEMRQNSNCIECIEFKRFLNCYSLFCYSFSWNFGKIIYTYNKYVPRHKIIITLFSKHFNGGVRLM